MVPDPAVIVSAAAEKVSSYFVLQHRGDIYKNKSRDDFMWIARIYSHGLIHLLFPFKCVKFITY